MTPKEYKAYEDRLLAIDKKITDLIRKNRLSDQDIEYFEKRLRTVSGIYYMQKSALRDVNVQIILNANSACSMQYTNFENMLSSVERELYYYEN